MTHALDLAIGGGEPPLEPPRERFLPAAEEGAIDGNVPLDVARSCTLGGGQDSWDADPGEWIRVMPLEMAVAPDPWTCPRCEAEHDSAGECLFCDVDDEGGER